MNDIKADYSGINTESQVLLPRNTIQTYLGSHLTNVALRPQGDISPQSNESTFYLIQSIDIQPTYIPTFAQARQQVLGSTNSVKETSYCQMH